MTKMQLVSFYGKSSPTAQNGQRKHPKGNKPAYRPNYSELTIKIRKRRKKVGNDLEGIDAETIVQG